MKSRWLVSLFMTLALIAGACGSSSEAATDEGSEATEEQVEAETTTTLAEIEEVEEEEEEEAEEVELAEGELDGMVIFESLCARCHSSDGSGGRGSNLQGIAIETPETTSGIEVVMNGGTGMPSFGARLTPEQIEAVTNYVWETF